MNHERLARTNGLIGEGESYSKPASFVVLQNPDEIEIEHDEVQPPPQIMRRPSSPPRTPIILLPTFLWTRQYLITCVNERLICFGILWAPSFF
eukprot:UN03000